MKVSQQIQSILSKYFAKEESLAERQTLYNWYDRLDSKAVITDKRIQLLQKANAKRLFALTKTKKTSVFKLIIGFCAAASVLLGIGFLGYTYYQESFNYVLTHEELAAIKPHDNKATLLLDSNQEIDLQQMALNDSMRIGRSMLHKDAADLLTLKLIPGTDNQKTHTITLKTAKAGQYTLVLADGTKVILNAASQLSFLDGFAAGARQVSLSGEAFFEVNKVANTDKFVVETKDQTSEVLGTQFNISAYDHEKQTITTLAEGSLKVYSKRNKTSLLLQANQQAILTANGFLKKDVDAEATIGWAKGYFYFNNNNTAEVIKQIAQWYDIEVAIDQKSNFIYAGKIPKDLDLAKLIELLEFADIKAKVLSNRKKEKKMIIN